MNRNSNAFHTPKSFTFKSTAAMEVGQHGLHALRAVVVAKGPVIEDVMIPLQVMEENFALALAKTSAVAISSLVQVTSLLMYFI